MNHENHVVISAKGAIGSVILNGQDMSMNVTEVNYTHKANDLPHIMLTLVCDSAEIETPVGELIIRNQCDD